MNRNRMGALVGATALALAATFAGAVPAHAVGGGDVNRTGTQVTFGVTEERRVTDLSCLTLTAPGTGTREIEWSTDQKSV